MPQTQARALLCACAILSIVSAQPGKLTLLPQACSDESSRSAQTCCPAGENGKPCGGPGRGRCAAIELAPWNEATNDHWIKDNELDERYMWPLMQVKRVCQCEYPYWGVACDECVFGRAGPACNETKVLVRKSAAKLPKSEKAQLVRGLHLLKRKTSAFFVPVAATGRYSSAAKFVPINTYDLFVWIHFLPIYKGGRERHAYDAVNMAHDGPGILTWHRLLLLWFERELQVVLEDGDFALPYWDWTDSNTECSVCTDDLIGATDERGFVGPPFSNWSMLCFTPDDDKEAYCDPRESQGALTRDRDDAYSLPTQETVDACLRFPAFDSLPYDIHSACSFRNCLEGYADIDTGHYSPRSSRSSNHNLVHRLFGGAKKKGAFGSGQSAANDPMFWLHHGNVDRIFEAHLRRYKPEALPSARKAPFGHGAEVPLIGIWPITKHARMFKASEAFGYTYEHMSEEGRFPWDGDQDPASMPKECRRLC